MKNYFNIFKTYFNKHNSEILVGIGVAGMITSTILAVKATPKAMKLLEERNKEELEKNPDFYKLGNIEIIKTAWKPYLYPCILTIASTTCIIGGTTISSKRNAALTTAYAITENAFSTYRNKVIETIGEKKEKNIRAKISQDNVDKNQPSNSQVIVTSNGNTLFKDSISERYFRSDINKIKNIINELNRKMTFDNYISLEDYYYELELKPMKHSDRLGWTIDDGLIEVYFNTCLAENDEPCIVLDFNIYPKYGFDRLS